MARVRLASLWILALGCEAKASSESGILFISFERGERSATDLLTSKDLLFSLTLHDSGQSTGPLPVDARMAEQGESLRLSFSSIDSSFAVILGSRLSSIDPGAGNPVAFMQRSLKNLTSAASRFERAAGMSLLISPSTVDWVVRPGDTLADLPMSLIQRLAA